MKMIQKFIPTKFKRIRPGFKRTPLFVTIHETGNESNGATALAHANLLYNGNQERVASWHYTVDENSIYQSVPDDEVAWHAGDGRNGEGNQASIGIEICVNQDGNFQQAKENAAWLVRCLMEQHNIPMHHVVQHHHWSGKDCPHQIRQEGWHKFIGLIQGGDVNQSAGYDKDAHYHRLLKLTHPMMRGEDIKRLQQRLKSKLVDGIYGTATAADVRAWQQIHDERGRIVAMGNGLVVDGKVGVKTWRALFREK
ncbi:N-acetylmuramoyl-L-alanine amidase [Seinonella peptonophila]|uniref:N-acetylmuramoyl-L-alanine amidase n=1 Tax=Seinonella peptonophila TaxID=112248 RepID=A0A1M4Z868_9BACL|nr:N-acetylmuramoyl-L-alanine amidase [Seinonella peptonophila]SHF13987.1 N-acetylmuramoyl-L-alanine amidase [Seinonella peptonophila]